MSPIMQDSINMIEMLPESEQAFVNEMLKRIVKAWDPDFTKVTPNECLEMEEAERELERGETVSHEEMWKHLKKI